MLWTEGLQRPSSEFWGLTPREVFACIEYYNEHERLLNYRAGLAASATYNVYRAKDAEPIQPLDFFEPRKKQQSSRHQIIAGLTKMEAQVKQRKKHGKPR